MRNKVLLVLSLTLANLLFAEQNPTALNDNNTSLPQVLPYQDILKSKQEASKNLLPMLPLDVNTNSTPSDLNVIGTININNTKYCYLLVESNKVIKATTGMVIKNKKIEDINEFGVTFNDKQKNSLFLPILSNQINESDIMFSNKENKKNSHNNMN